MNKEQELKALEQEQRNLAANQERLANKIKALREQKDWDEYVHCSHILWEGGIIDKLHLTHVLVTWQYRH